MRRTSVCAHGLNDSSSDDAVLDAGGGGSPAVADCMSQTSLSKNSVKLSAVWSVLPATSRSRPSSSDRKCHSNDDKRPHWLRQPSQYSSYLARFRRSRQRAASTILGALCTLVTAFETLTAMAFRATFFVEPGRRTSRMMMDNVDRCEFVGDIAQHSLVTREQLVDIHVLRHRLTDGWLGAGAESRCDQRSATHERVVQRPLVWCSWRSGGRQRARGLRRCQKGRRKRCIHHTLIQRIPPINNPILKKYSAISLVHLTFLSLQECPVVSLLFVSISNSSCSATELYPRYI